MALTALLTTLSGGMPSSGRGGGPDDHVTDAVGNLGFGINDALAAADLALVNLARARDLMNEAERTELEQARELEGRP